MPGAVRRELGHPGSRSPFDRPIGGSRALAFTVAPLAELKAIGASRPAHATVNDVLLTIVAGGLRAWLAAGGAATPHLHAQVPVSLHHRDEGADDLGNRDSFINVDLPLAEADPLVRLDLISAETSKRKRLGDAEELYDLFHALGRMKYVGSAVQRLAKSAREFSVAISNVPGPSAPVSVVRRRVQHLFSSSEPAADDALRIRRSHAPGTSGSACAPTRRRCRTSRGSQKRSSAPMPNCAVRQSDNRKTLGGRLGWRHRGPDRDPPFPSRRRRGHLGQAGVGERPRTGCAPVPPGRLGP